jgi:hypothetical protein
MAAAEGARVTERYQRLANTDTDQAPTVVSGAGGKTFTDWIVSNERVGRDGHIVLNSAVINGQENYRKNPIITWVHDILQPPIARGGTIVSVSLSSIAPGVTRPAARHRARCPCGGSREIDRP